MVLFVFVAFASQPPKAAEPLTLLLRWDHQFQFAGYYAALWKGYYSDAGLEVTIRTPFKGESVLNSVDEVMSGAADFGIGAADLLVALDKGKPVVVLSTFFHESAVEFYIDRRSGYSSLADLSHLRVARRIGDLIDTEFQAMLNAEGLSPDIVKPITSYGSEQAVADWSLDLSPGYSFVTPFILKELGVDFITLRPRDHGIYFYGDSLFTRRDLLDSKEDTVNKFVTASQLGWQYALENPEEIADLIATKVKRRFMVTDPVAFNRAQIEGVKKLTLYPLVEPGHINPGRWQHMHDWLQEIGMVTKPIDLNLFIHDPLIKKEAFERLLLEILAGLFVVAVILGIISWIWFLRRAVATRTSELTSNIEQRKRAEIALQKLNEGLEQTVEDRTAELRGTQEKLLRKERLAALGGLTATVSHELRNPLGAMRSATDAIKKLADRRQPHLTRAIALLDRSQIRCDKVITDLLDYTRAPELTRSVSRIDDWLDGLLDDYEVPPGITLRRELGSDVEIGFDHDRLDRSVRNLIDNACQAMQPGDGDAVEAEDHRLTVATRRADRGLELSIKDTGVGIAPDAREKVFEPLYSTKSFGTGLGLALVKQIAEQHGGGVEIMGEPENGTEIVLWLPLPTVQNGAAA